MRTTIRQGIVAAPTVASAPNFLLNDGGAVHVRVTSVPVIFTFAHGSANYLAAEQGNLDNAWGPFVGATPNYLYWELDEATGNIVRGSTTLPVAVGSSSPVSPATGQMWFNTTNTTMYVWNGTTWKTTIRVMAGTADGTSATAEPLGSQVGLTGSFRAGYLLRDGTNKAIRVTTDPNTGAQFKFLTTETEVVSAGGDGSVVKFENSAVFARGGEVIPAFSLVYAYAAPAGENTAMLVGLASSAFADFETKAAIGMVVESLALNEVTQLITSGIVYNQGWNWALADIGKPLYCGTAGEITLTKPNFAKVRCVGNVFSTKEVLLNFGWETDFDGVGPMGASGYSGVAGASGFSGYSGMNGATGTSGYSGMMGESGFSGYSGIDGAAGASGFSGYSGIDGAAGASGFSGYSGIDGSVVAETANQVVFGTGTAIDSSPSFQWIETDKRLRVNSASPSSNHLTETPGGIQIYGAPHASTGAGAYVQIFGGQGGQTAGAGGDIDIRGGLAADGLGGGVQIRAGSSGGANIGSDVSITAGAAGTGVGGTLGLTGGAGGTTGNGGPVTITGGPATTGTGGAVQIYGGVPIDGDGGSVFIAAGVPAGLNKNGGDVNITATDKTGSGLPGHINLTIPATGTLLINGSAGTNGQVLTSAGPGAAPTWASVGGSFQAPIQFSYRSGVGAGTAFNLGTSGTTTGVEFATHGQTGSQPFEASINAGVVKYKSLAISRNYDSSVVPFETKRDANTDWSVTTLQQMLAWIGATYTWEIVSGSVPAGWTFVDSGSGSMTAGIDHLLVHSGGGANESYVTTSDAPSKPTVIEIAFAFPAEGEVGISWKNLTAGTNFDGLAVGQYAYALMFDSTGKLYFRVGANAAIGGVSSNTMVMDFVTGASQPWAVGDTIRLSLSHSVNFETSWEAFNETQSILHATAGRVNHSGIHSVAGKPAMVINSTSVANPQKIYSLKYWSRPASWV